MRFVPSAVLGSLAVSAGILASGAGPAAATQTTACPDTISPSFARVQLFNGANCAGGSMIVRGDDASPNRPNFLKFRNYDGKVYDVQNNRSSVRVAQGTCVKLYDGGNYTGAATPTICGRTGPIEWNLTELDNRASSMRVSGPTATPTPAPTPAPTPTPTPAPTPTPGAGGFPADVKSAPEKAKYDGAGPFRNGKGCIKGFLPGAQRMQAWLRANWGKAKIDGAVCRANTNNKAQTSIHGVGRASDWYMNANKASDRAEVNQFIRRMTANKAAQARAMGVQYWIWNREQFTVRNTSVYRRAYDGPIPHTDHVHVEQNLAGANLRTSYWKLAGR